MRAQFSEQLQSALAEAAGREARVSAQLEKALTDNARLLDERNAEVCWSLAVLVCAHVRMRAGEEDAAGTSAARCLAGASIRNHNCLHQRCTPPPRPTPCPLTPPRRRRNIEIVGIVSKQRMNKLFMNAQGRAEALSIFYGYLYMRASSLAPQRLTATPCIFGRQQQPPAAPMQFLSARPRR